MSPHRFTMVTEVTYKPAGCLGVNHFTVVLHWKRNGSQFVQACLPSRLLSLNAPSARPTQLPLSPDGKVYYFFRCIYPVLRAHQTRLLKKRDWNVVHLRSRWAALAKWPTSVYLANKAVHCRHMDKIRPIFPHMFLPLSVPFFSPL